jgi:hypothetical protein
MIRALGLRQQPRELEALVERQPMEVGRLPGLALVALGDEHVDARSSVR